MSRPPHAAAAASQAGSARSRPRRRSRPSGAEGLATGGRGPSAATLSRGSRRRPISATRAPSPANRMAVASPMPLLGPVHGAARLPENRPPLSMVTPSEPQPEFRASRLGRRSKMRTASSGSGLVGTRSRRDQVGTYMGDRPRSVGRRGAWPPFGPAWGPSTCLAALGAGRANRPRLPSSAHSQTVGPPTSEDPSAETFNSSGRAWNGMPRLLRARQGRARRVHRPEMRSRRAALVRVGARATRVHPPRERCRRRRGVGCQTVDLYCVHAA